MKLNREDCITLLKYMYVLKKQTTFEDIDSYANFYRTIVLLNSSAMLVFASYEMLDIINNNIYDNDDTFVRCNAIGCIISLLNDIADYDDRLDLILGIDGESTNSDDDRIQEICDDKELYYTLLSYAAITFKTYGRDHLSEKDKPSNQLIFYKTTKVADVTRMLVKVADNKDIKEEPDTVRSNTLHAKWVVLLSRILMHSKVSESYVTEKIKEEYNATLKDYLDSLEISCDFTFYELTYALLEHTLQQI